MKNFTILFLIILFALLQAQSGYDDAGLFPEDTLTFISLNMGKKMKKQWKQTPFAKALKEPEVVEFLIRVDEKWKVSKEYRDFSRRFASVFGIKVSELLLHVDNCSFAWTNIPKGSEPISFAFTIRFPADFRPQADAMLDKTTGILPISHTQYKYGKFTVHKLKGLENAIFYVQTKDRFLFATTSELIAKMIDRLTGKEKKSLAATDHYKKFSSKAPANPCFIAYFNSDELFQGLWWYLPEEERRNLEILKVRDWKNLGISFAFRDEGFFSFIGLQLKNEPAGLNVLFPHQKIDEDSFRFIPMNSSAGLVTQVSLGEIWRESLDCFRRMQPRFFEDFHRNLEQGEKALLNFTVEHFLDNFGPEYSIFHFPDEQSNIIPRWVAVLTVKNPEFTHKALSTLASLIQYRFKSKDYNGTTLYYLAPIEYDHSSRSKREMVNLGMEEKAMLHAVLGKLSYYIQDGKMVVSPLPQTLMDYFDSRMADTMSKNQEQVKPVPGSDYSLLGYFDIRDFAPQYYQTFLRFLPALEAAGNFYFSLPVETADFPRIKKITQHFSPLKLGIARDHLYYSAAVRSNLGIEFILPCIGALAAGDDSLGRPISRFLNNGDQFLRTYEKAQKLSKQERHFEAGNLWKDLVNRSSFEYFRYIAGQKQKRSEKKYHKQRLAVEKNWNKTVSSKYLGKWQSYGDWLPAKEALKTRSDDHTFWLMSTKEKLSQYVVEFEVKDMEHHFEFWYHWHKDDSGFVRYDALPFYENKNLKGWVPFKIKIKGNHVSYWYGLKHFQRNAKYTEGYFAIAVPGGSALKIRNVKISEVKVDKPEPKTEKPNKPSLHITCRDNDDPVSAGQWISYSLTLTNEGGAVAKDIIVKATFSDNLIPKTVRNKIACKVKKQTVESSSFSIQPGEKLTIRFRAKGNNKGVGVFRANVGFAGIPVDFVIAEYTVID